VSEQQAEQSGHQTGSPGAGPADHSESRPDRLAASERPPEDGAASAGDTAVEPAAETTKAEMPKAEPFMVQGVQTPRGDRPEADRLNAETRKADAPGNAGSKPDTPEAASAAATHRPRELLIMSPGEHAWTRSEDAFESGEPAAKPATQGLISRHRFAALAAMLVLALMAGAAGGALATIALSHRTEAAAVAAPQVATLETSVGRIDADITALKAGMERTANASLTQFNKSGERLERMEKAQTDAAARLAKLSDSLDKLRAAAPAAPTPVAAAAPKDVTGTVTVPANAQALPIPQLHASPATTPAGNAPTTEVGRLPTVDGWVLREVGRGAALIEGRGGLYEVIAGDPVPGLGRVDAIRKQDGRWVVVTSRGLIVAR